jgi:hypothetical protein
MRYLLLPSLLFSTVLACQTKHPVGLDAIDAEENQPPEVNPDAGEGAKAKQEEGKVGKTDIKKAQQEATVFTYLGVIDNETLPPAPTGMDKPEAASEDVNIGTLFQS